MRTALILLLLLFGCATSALAAEQSPVRMLNPYNVECALDTCVVLPIPVFRKTTQVITGYNLLVVENQKLYVLDSLSSVQRVVDSTTISTKDSVIQLHKDNIKLLEQKAHGDKLRWFLYGSGIGSLVATVGITLLIIGLHQ
jgi:hypothetical protein